MAAADAGIRGIVTGRLPADRWQEPRPDRGRERRRGRWAECRRDAWGEPGQEGRDLRVVREQITGLLELWQRVAARCGELGEGSERECDRGMATAGLMRMGTVMDDTWAQVLAGLLAGLDCQLSGDNERRGSRGCGTDRESAA